MIAKLQVLTESIKLRKKNLEDKYKIFRVVLMSITKHTLKMDTRAKLLVFPLIDSQFYKHDPFKEYINNSEKQKESSYQKFIDELLVTNVYPLLAKSNNINHLEEIRLLIEQYFPNERFVSYATNSKLYFSYLTELSKVFLTHRDGQISLKYWESTEHNENENKILGPYRGIYKIAMWNSLNRIFTTDLLAILYLLDLDMTEEYYLKSFVAGINVADTQLDKVLSKGIAETHLHLNAAGSFDLTWQTLMANQEVKDSIYISTFYNDKEVKYYVKAMSIVRIVLAMYLKERDSNQYITLSEYMKKHIPHGKKDFKTNDFLHWITNGESLSDKITERKLSEIIEDLKLNLKLLPDNLVEPDFVSRLGQNDIIHKLLETYGEDNTVERVFLLHSIKYLTSKGEVDELYSDIFWQYIRVKNLVFQLHVQQNSINGLEYFVEYFGRSTDVRIDNEEQRLNYLLNYQVRNRFLKKLEVRISVGPGENDKAKKLSLARKLKSFFYAYLELIKEFEYTNTSAPAIGIITHFIKSRIKVDDNEYIFDAYEKKLKNIIMRCWRL